MNDPERKLSSPVATTQEVGAPGNCQGVEKHFISLMQNKTSISLLQDILDTTCLKRFKK